MKKILKGCIGIFIFILTLFMFNNDVLADHSSCATSSCVKIIQNAYVCPNTGATDEDSATTCLNAIKNGNTSSMAVIDSTTNVPVMYDATHSTIIALQTVLNPYQVTRIAAYSYTTVYDPDKLELFKVSSDKKVFPFTYDDDDEKVYQWSPSIVYGKGVTGVSGGKASTSDSFFPGVINIFNKTNEAGSYLLPHKTNAVYPTYSFFRVKSDASGQTYLKLYEDDIAAYGTWNEVASTDTSNTTHTYFTIAENVTFNIGEEAAVSYPIENIKIYNNSGKSVEYYFGVPGTTYTSSSHVSFDPGVETYDLYLPANTTSIYIDAMANAEASTSGDVGTKVVSIGTGTFTITGTTSGTDSTAINYIITYHVPDNTLSNFTSNKGKWGNGETFSGLGSNYTIYLTAAEAASVTVESTLADSTGGLQIEKNGTVTRAKAKLTSGSSFSETLTNVTDGTVYTIKSYGADCFGDYYTALNTCDYKTYNITFKITDRTLKSITVTGTASNTVYGIAPTDFNRMTKTYTVYVPSSESSVIISSEANNTDVTPNPKNVSVQLNDFGINVGVINVTASAADIAAGDTDHEEYTVNVYKLSDNAELDSFTSTALTGSTPVGTLQAGTSYTDSNDSNMTVIPYTLTVGKSVEKVKLTTTAKKSTSFVNAEANVQTLAQEWTINTTTPYESVINSESCKSDYSGITNNVCKKTKIIVTAVVLNDDAEVDQITVADSSSASTSYTVTDKGNDTYSVTVPSGKSSVYFAVTAHDKTSPATVSYDNKRDSNGMVTLSAEITAVTATITAQDTSISKTYTVNIRKASTVTTLDTLSVSDGVFSPAMNTTNPVKNNTGKIEANKAGVTISAKATGAFAKLDDQTNGTREYTEEPWNFTNDRVQTKTITVYAESCFVDGDTCHDDSYVITLTRMKTESSLSKITVKKKTDSSVIEEITVASGTTSYTVGIPSDVNDVIVEVTKADEDETVKFDSDTTAATSKEYSVSAGDNNKAIHVESEYGDSYKTDYTLNLHKVSDDTSLTFTSTKGLGTPNITAHATLQNTYVLKIINTELNTSITSTAATTAYIDGVANEGNTKTETWTFANNETYTVKVYPERCKAAYNNGTACTESDAVTYTLLRNAVSNETKPDKIYVYSADGNTLHGTIDFTATPAPTTYQVNVPAGTQSVKLVVDAKEGQSVSLPGTDGVVSGLIDGTNTENVIMTASDGSTQLTYPVIVYVPSTAKELTSISVASPATISPTTIADATDNTFTVSVSDKVNSVSVSAQSSATSFINTEANGNSITNATWDISDATGSSSYQIKIYPETCKAAHVGETPCSDSDATIYTLNINKLSSSKDINGVTVNDVEATYDSSDSKWKVKLPSTTTQAVVACTAPTNTQCTGSTITTLTEGANSTSVNITAEDSSTGTAAVEIYLVHSTVALDTLTFSNGSVDGSLADNDYDYNAKFSTSKPSTTVVPTPKYNGTVVGLTDGKLPDWTFTGAPTSVDDYKFSVQSESCDSQYNTTEYAAIYATCQTKEYTLTYVPVSASAVLGSISVKNTDTSDTNEYFTESSINDLTYTVYVPSTVQNVTVTVAPEISGTTVSNNGTATLNNLDYGKTATKNATFVVTPQDTTVSPNTYVITVYRLNDDAELSALSATPNGTIGTLVSGTYDYNLELTDGTVTTTNINATTNHAEATMKVNTETTSTKHQLTNKEWTLSDNTFEIKVSSEQCAHQNSVITTCSEHTYKLTKVVLSNDIILENITVKNSAETSDYTLDKPFSSSYTSYTTNLDNGTTGAVIIVDPGSTGITITGQSITSGGTVARDTSTPLKIVASGLKTGDNTVTISIVAENKVTTGSYTINLHVKNNDTSLSLEANPGTLSSASCAGGTCTLTVPNGTTSSELTATIPSGAQVTMNGTAKTPDSNSKVTDTWSDFVDDDTYTIVVTPEQGSAVTYVITVDVQAPEQSGDNNLVSLTASPGTLSSATCAGGSCTLTVPYGTTSSTLTAKLPEGATIKMGGNTVTPNSDREASATWSGFTDGATYEIIVYAEDTTPKTYTITVDVQDPTDEDKDSSLKSIKVTKFESDPEVEYTVYEPTFVPSDTSSDSFSYTVFVPYETTKVDLAAEATNTSLTPVFSNQSEIVLGVGDNQETISVTSADSSNTTVYHINIYRISNKSDLTALSLGVGDLSPDFDPQVYNYTTYISNLYPAATVSYTLPYAKAYATSETNTATSDTWNFNGGTDNVYTLHTYAESCKEKFKDVEGNTCVDSTYTITATFFSPKITSNEFGLSLTTATDGGVTIDIIADARLYSTGSDIKGVQTDNPETLLKLFEADETTEVADGSDLATGMVLKLLINNVEYDKRYIVIPGEVNGDADIDVSDVLDTVDHILGNTTLDGVYFKAADIAEDDDIDVTDILDIVDIILGN